MAKVTVRTIGPLRQVLGGPQVEMTVADGDTVHALLRRLGEEKGGEFARFVSWLEGLGRAGAATSAEAGAPAGAAAPAEAGTPAGAAAPAEAGAPAGPGVPAYSPLRVLLNGRDVFPEKCAEVVLTEGDELLVFSPVAGG